MTGRLTRLVTLASVIPVLYGTTLLGIQAQEMSQADSGIHKIQHIVIIMQENRSFDSYFGTYPGADGILMKNGVPTVCMPDPRTHHCSMPYHDNADDNVGARHQMADGLTDVDQGKMDGFLAVAEHDPDRGCTHFGDPKCDLSSPPDVMGYHDGRDLPNYWTYARDFVLQDHMFSPVASWSLPAHLYLVSGWSASCSRAGNPASCTSDPIMKIPGNPLNFAWTDITYLLNKYGVSWKYYIASNTDRWCPRDAPVCPGALKSNQYATPFIWTPLPAFDTVKGDNQTGNVQDISHFYTDAKNGALPAVSWVIPNTLNSDHPPALVSVGQSYVTGLVNTIMRSATWDSTAIFLAWDDWGGFYDHVQPPTVDQNGYGFRVPALVINAYVRKGYIDHQTLSFDAYLKFIEDDFLGGQRLDPRTDGRPDPRPTVRENAPLLGNLANDFDFSQAPRAPVLLSVTPATDLLKSYATAPFQPPPSRQALARRPGPSLASLHRSERSPSNLLQ
ncbi:MAG TPA: alkaline phosphatase family protein [Chloroflexota bacterium]|nr:alkaline phosphatase family protein [Chloroflexota bacterium]